MKNTTKLMIAAAFMVVAAGVAQAETLRADVPFAFRAGGKVMPAGAYNVEISGASSQIVVIRNYEARETSLMIATSQVEPSRAWKAKGDPMLSFECADGRCTLIRVWNGASDSALAFPNSSRRAVQSASIMDVPLVKAAE